MGLELSQVSIMAKPSFSLKPLFPNSIIRVRTDLLPEGFEGSVEECAKARKQMAWCIDKIGELSAKAQSLHTTVTSSGKLSEKNTIYLLASVAEGLVTGVLKVGLKDLYLFDEESKLSCHKSTPSILDFYIHESHQRRGMGKRLFERMLADQQWSVGKCAVDRPSAMMRSFLAKHYGLVQAVPQPNKFVLYTDFFSKDKGNGGNGGANGGGVSDRKPKQKSIYKLNTYYSMADIMKSK